MLIFVPVFRLAFISKKSTVYIIAFFNVLSDFCQLTVIGLYLSPCIIADSYLIDDKGDGPLSLFIGSFFLFAWFFESTAQVVMAVNRLTVITFEKYNVFTFRSTVFLFFLITSLTAATSYTLQYLLPCCRFVGDHNVLSVRFILRGEYYNYSYAVLLSYDVFSTFSSTICYIVIFHTIKKTVSQMTSNMSKERIKQDKRYLVQFVFVSIFYVFSWVFFETLPYIIPEGPFAWYVVVSIFVTLNCSSNSVIYLCVNKEVQKSLPILWLRNRFNKPATSNN